MLEEITRELTVKELIENSNLENKDLILDRLKADDFRFNKRLDECEKIISNQRELINSYRDVLKDMIYSNWIE